MNDWITAYQWETGVEFSVEVDGDFSVEMSKESFGEITDELSSVDELPSECRVSTPTYAVELIVLPDAVSINHFNVYTEDHGVGSYLIDQIKHVADVHGKSTVTIWIGNANKRTAAFLDKHEFEYSKMIDDAYGETFEGAVEL